jgi:hypothetical protein
MCGVAGVLHAEPQARSPERELARVRDALRRGGGA